MRAKLANEVRRYFDELIKEKAQQFRKVKPGKVKLFGKMEPEIPPGYRLYLWRFERDLYFYLMLVIGSHNIGNAFTLECAYTRNERFPSLSGVMHPYDIPRCDIIRDEPIDGDFCFRIGNLWEPRDDHWWWIVPPESFEEFDKWLLEGKIPLYHREVPIEEAMKNVKPCVEDAVDRIVKYAIPYFEGIIEQYKSDPKFWEKFEDRDIVKIEKERILKSKGGLTDKECAWAGCKKKRVRGVALCIDHLYESYARNKHRRNV